VTKPRILVAEDDRIIARSLSMILEQLGYEVTALASTGQAAIREAEETKPDLILMDIVLDGATDGMEVTRAIRSHLSIPVTY
jgi:CheY-like chemotaxis protein